jgi:hypothetical protein
MSPSLGSSRTPQAGIFSCSPPAARLATTSNLAMGSTGGATPGAALGRRHARDARGRQKLPPVAPACPATGGPGRQGQIFHSASARCARRRERPHGREADGHRARRGREARPSRRATTRPTTGRRARSPTRANCSPVAESDRTGGAALGGAALGPKGRHALAESTDRIRRPDCGQSPGDRLGGAALGGAALEAARPQFGR